MWCKQLSIPYCISFLFRCNMIDATFSPALAMCSAHILRLTHMSWSFQSITCHSASSYTTSVSTYRSIKVIKISSTTTPFRILRTVQEKSPWVIDNKSIVVSLFILTHVMETWTQEQVALISEKLQCQRSMDLQRSINQRIAFPLRCLTLCDTHILFPRARE